MTFFFLINNELVDWHLGATTGAPKSQHIPGRPHRCAQLLCLTLRHNLVAFRLPNTNHYHSWALETQTSSGFGIYQHRSPKTTNTSEQFEKTTKTHEPSTWAPPQVRPSTPERLRRHHRCAQVTFYPGTTKSLLISNLVPNQHTRTPLRFKTTEARSPN